MTQTVVAGDAVQHNIAVDGGVPAWMRIGVPLLALLLMVLVAILPPGENASAGYLVPGPNPEDPWENGEWVYDPPPGMAEGRILGQNTFFLLLISLAFTYRAPFWWLRRRTRICIHKVLGVLILTLALVHAILLPLVGVFRGWLSGLLSLGLLGMHGTTGFGKRRLVQRLGLERWRYMHLATAWTALLLGVEHTLLFGQHLGLLRELVYGS